MQQPHAPAPAGVPTPTVHASQEARYLRWLLAIAGPFDSPRLGRCTDGNPQWSPADFALLRAREVAGNLIAGAELAPRDARRARELWA